MTKPAPAAPVPFLRRDGVRRVVRTFVIAFLGLLLPGLLGWLADLTEWARAEGQTPFPDARSLAYLGVTAIAAGFIATLNAIVIGVEDLTGTGILRTPPPGRHRSETGAVDTRTIAVVAVVIAVVALLVLLL